MAKKRIVATGNWSNMTQPEKPQNRPMIDGVGQPTKTPKQFPMEPVQQNEEQQVQPQTAPDKPGLFQKAKNMAKAYASKGLSGKRANEEVVEIRSMSCHGMKDIGLAPCEFRGTSEENEGRHYCLECGCGDRQATWLNALNEDDYTKLHFPNVVCPLNMPGFTNYTPLSAESEERVSHYNGFTRKAKIEQFGREFDVDLVQLSISVNTDE